MSGKPPMRIAYVTTVSALFGAERSLIETMRMINRDRFVPLLVTIDPGPLEEAARAHGVIVKRLPWIRTVRRSMLGMQVSTTIRFARWLRAHHVAVLQLSLYAPHLNVELGTCIVAARLAGAKFMLRHRTVGSWWLSVAEKFWLSRCDRIVSVSRGAVEPWLRPRRSDLFARIEAGRVDVIPSSRDIAALVRTEVDQSFRSRWGIPPYGRIVGMAARFHPYKRQDLFVEAAGLIHQAEPDAWFVMMGGAGDAPSEAPGPYEQALRHRVQALGIAHRTVFAGYLQDPLPVMKQCDVIVLPSQHEALGGVLIEAMALGVPVVASRDGGMPEVVRDGETGLLVDGAEPSAYAGAILELLRDRSRADRMGERGKVWAQRFDTHAIVRSLEACYDDVIRK